MNLGELIRHHKDGRSYDDLAKACNRVITSQRLQQLATAPIKEFPKPPAIKALAKVLRVKEAVVVLAAAESIGLDAKLPVLSEVLTSAASDLTDEQVAAISHVIRAFKSKEGEGLADRPAANTPPARGATSPGPVTPFRKIEDWEVDEAAREDYTRGERDRPNRD